jgi:hypothetical protein
MEDQFEISKKYVDDFTPVIKFAEKNLLIEVSDEKPLANKKTVLYRANYLDDANKRFSKYFTVINGYSVYGFANWDYNLFIRMIQFYSKHMLDTYADWIETENLLASFFYDSNSGQDKLVDVMNHTELVADPDQLVIF